MSPTASVGQRSLRSLLLINPNTNPAVTAQVRRAALAVAPAGTRIEAVNPAVGPFAIETVRDRLEASRHVIALVAERRTESFDGYVLACFDDLGVAEARRLVAGPVTSMFGASIAAARRAGGRFTIVTTVESAVPGIESLAAAYEIADMCTVRAAGVRVAEAAARTADAEDRLFEAITLAIRKDHASAIVLGSGALAGRAAELETQFGLPFIDGLAAAVSSPVPDHSFALSP